MDLLSTDFFRELLSLAYQEDEGEESCSGVVATLFTLMYRLNVTGAEEGGRFPPGA